MEGTIEFRALYDVLLERWKTIVICSVIGIALGAAVCVLTTRQYKSHGRILVMQKLAKFVGDKGKVLDPKAYDALFATHLQLIGSPRIVQQAVDTYGLEQIASLRDAMDGNRETVSEVIVDQLNVRRAGSGDSDGAFVILLEFKHTHAKDAKVVVDAILKTYRSYIQQSSLDGQEKAVSLISDMEANAAREVEAKASAYRDFISQAPGIWNRNTLENPHQTRIEKLNAELTDLQLKKVGIASRIDIMRDSPEDQYSVIERMGLIDDVHVTRLNLLVSVKKDEINEYFQSRYPERQEHASARYDDLLKMQREYGAKSKNLGEMHPTMQEMQADIDVLEQRLNENTDDVQSTEGELSIHPQELLKAYQCLLENDLANVTRHIAFVQKSLDAEKAAARRLLDISLKGEQRQHEYERSRELYGVMLDLLREQRLVNDFGDYVAEILASPKAGKQVWPNVPIIIMLFTVIGFFAGIVLAICLEWWPMPPKRTDSPVWDTASVNCAV